MPSRYGLPLAISFASVFALGIWTALPSRTVSAHPASDSNSNSSTPTSPLPARRASSSATIQQDSQQQQQQPQDQQLPQAQKPLQVNTELVSVFITVRNKEHGIVNDLKQDDFRVFEDGQEQKVAFFSKDVNMPISLGILIDTSGSQIDVLGAEQDAASRFVHEVLRKKDEAMLLSFDLDIDMLADFTEDPSVLEAAIRRTVINAPAAGAGGTTGTVPNGQNGGTDLYDAVYLAAHDKLASEAGRKAIIVLTDAEDTGSKLSLNDCIEAAQRADSVVHVLLISDEGFYMRALMGYSGAMVARKMADQTGGRVIEVHSTKSLEKAFDELSEELRLQYVVGYYPTNMKRDGGFRKLRVEIKHPDLKILARRGYYAPTQ
jgi:VWFA-related protein